MIPEAEIRRLAGTWSMDPMAVDLDYVLGCFLAGLYGQAEKPKLRFKGGTCLRKCYFQDYRFSEDLDFTAEQHFTAEALQRLLERAVQEIEDRWQIDLSLKPIRIETVDDDYGKESYQARLYYRGPLRRGGDPRAIRVDVTTREVLVFSAVSKRILHPYSDAGDLDGVEVPCYDLHEALAEKIRAIAGQRRYAIARDLYDIAQLAVRCQVEVGRLAGALPDKMRVKGLAPGPIDLGRLKSRRDDFEADWDRNLMHLLTQDNTTSFESAWYGTTALLQQLNHRLDAAAGKG